MNDFQVIIPRPKKGNHKKLVREREKHFCDLNVQGILSNGGEKNTLCHILPLKQDLTIDRDRNRLP